MASGGGGGGEGTKSGGRSLVKKGTHGTRLPEESVHCQDRNDGMMNGYKIQLRVECGEDDSNTFDALNESNSADRCRR